MKYNLTPFVEYHESLMRVQDGQLGEVGEGWGRYAAKGEAHSMFHGERLIACAGLHQLSRKRASVWAVVSGTNQPRDMIALTRAVSDFLMYAGTRFHRLETVCSLGFIQAHRWAKMLGFHAEGVLECYDDDENDCVLYSRINRGRIGRTITTRRNRRFNYFRHSAGIVSVEDCQTQC